MKKAGTKMMIQVIGVIFFAALAFGFIIKMEKQGMEVYGNKQAHIIARDLANSINALASSETGEIEKTLNGEWDISISKNKILASRDDFKGSEELLVKVKNAELKLVSKILIIKKGDLIEVKEA